MTVSGPSGACSESRKSGVSLVDDPVADRPDQAEALGNRHEQAASAHVAHRPLPIVHAPANHRTSTIRRSRERMRRRDQPSNAKVAALARAIGRQVGQARAGRVGVRQGRGRRMAMPGVDVRTLLRRAVAAVPCGLARAGTA
jgi:hypothetical protein